MTTEAEHEAPPAEKQTPKPDDNQAELQRLLEFKKARVRNNDQTLCPACTTLVPISVNQCPHCDSDIAANNALVRESLRRLDEITAEIETRHSEHISGVQAVAKRRIVERIKQFFSSPGAQTRTAEADADDEAPRILNDVWEGDLLRVIECQGDWCKIKTRDGKTGWVYSTLLRDK